MAKAKITKHQVVLRRGLVSEVFVRYAHPDNPAQIVNLTADGYEALGKPAVITVTVEPGDKLNKR